MVKMDWPEALGYIQVENFLAPNSWYMILSGASACNVYRWFLDKQILSDPLTFIRDVRLLTHAVWLHLFSADTLFHHLCKFSICIQFTLIVRNVGGSTFGSTVMWVLPWQKMLSGSWCKLFWCFGMLQDQHFHLKCVSVFNGNGFSWQWLGPI